MIVALAARLLPTLERDAAGIALAARARGVTASGRRSAADLVSPLVSLSLERSLGLAEAMEARGYGGRQRTREPGPPADGPERAMTASGAALCLLTAWLLLLRGGHYLYYDLLSDPVTTAAIGRVGCVRRADRGRDRGGAMAALSFTDVRYALPRDIAARPGRRHAGGRARRAGADRGRVGLRQVDAAAGRARSRAPLPRRRAGRPGDGRRPGHARPPAGRAGPPRRAGVPGSRGAAGRPAACATRWRSDWRASPIHRRRSPPGRRRR